MFVEIIVPPSVIMRTVVHAHFKVFKNKRSEVFENCLPLSVLSLHVCCLITVHAWMPAGIRDWSSLFHA